jgi:hypothetical protein
MAGGITIGGAAPAPTGGKGFELVSSEEQANITASRAPAETRARVLEMERWLMM